MASLRSAPSIAFTLPIYMVVFAAAFFRLPYLFPVSPSVSVSYVYQYNNHVAVLIFLAGAIGLSLLIRDRSFRPAPRDSRVSAISAFIAGALCVALGLFYNWLSSPNGLQGENIYFYGRLTQLAAGKTIYRGFEFAYGPLWLYLPFWTGKLLHLSLIHGYTLFWLLSWAVGIWILYRIVNAIEIRCPYRTAIFFIFVVDFAQALWPQGINYSPVRSLLTAGLAMLVYETYKRGHSIETVAAVAVVCAAIATAVSPEHGIAFMLGTGLFFAVCIRQRPSRYWLSVVIMGVAFLTIVIISERTGVYALLHSFSTGGYNYPILPYPGVLCVMALYLVAACVGALAFRRRKTDSLLAYLLCICIFGLPACFGRADSGHMQIGAFSALIIAALAIGRFPRIALLAAAAFVYWPGTAQIHSDLPIIRENVEQRVFNPAERSDVLYLPTAYVLHLLHRDAHREAIEAKVIRHSSDSTTPPLPGGFIVNAPLGFTRNGYADTSGNVDYGYFSGLQDVIVPSQIDQVMRWLEAHPQRQLILPHDWEAKCCSFPEADQSGFRFCYGIHWADPKRRMQVNLPLCDFISAHYSPNDPGSSDAMQLWHPVAIEHP
jgi:hypothetical protein